MSMIAIMIVAFFGVTIMVSSLAGIISPDRLMRAVRSVMDQNWGIVFAVVVRIVLGVSLLLAARASKFVMPFQVLGWLALIAAAVLPVVGRNRLIFLLDWLQSLSGIFIRLWLVFGVLFGAFLLYGVSGVFG